MSRAVEAAVSLAVGACAEHGVTPDALAAALLSRGEALGRGRTWGRGPARSESYRRFITARFPCALTGARGTQAAHLPWAWHFERPPHGRSLKVDDFRCVPLSPGAHRRVDGGRASDADRLVLALAMVDCLVAWIEATDGR